MMGNAYLAPPTDLDQVKLGASERPPLRSVMGTVQVAWHAAGSRCGQPLFASLPMFSDSGS